MQYAVYRNDATAYTLTNPPTHTHTRIHLFLMTLRRCANVFFVSTFVCKRRAASVTKSCTRISIYQQYTLQAHLYINIKHVSRVGSSVYLYKHKYDFNNGLAGGLLYSMNMVYRVCHFFSAMYSQLYTLKHAPNEPESDLNRK
jgi:hypothetical protein